MKRTVSPRESQVTTLLNDLQDFVHPVKPVKQRIAQGKRLRDEVSRTDHGIWKAPSMREDPLELLQSQDKGRIDDLIPMRYGRMMASPFAFYRGAALIMASDLSLTPRTGQLVQACGDCHLSNFGVFATPERNVIFDLNDFDETLPGPWEWDMKRLSASFAIAAEDVKLSNGVAERAVAALSRAYREKMEEFAHMKSLDVWYHRIDFEYLMNQIAKAKTRDTANRALKKIKEKRSHEGALAKLTEVVDGQRRIKDNPPTVYHPDAVTAQVTKDLLLSYLESLWHSRRRLVQRYHFVDIAVKVVGVGSVGTLAGIILLQGEGSGDDLILLQLKQAVPSVLERYVGKSAFQHPGQRIVSGQRLLQASADLFLGWASGPKRDFYVRQLMDMKASVPIDQLGTDTFVQYAEVCGYTLARAHARSGDPAVIHGYLGKSDAFDEALVKFAFAYRKQNEKDFDSLIGAINRGRIHATPGV
jgi:uncharacterized protein (DUF2252 family)